MVWFNLAGGASILGEFSCRDAAWGMGLCCSGGFPSPAPARGAQVAGRRWQVQLPFRGAAFRQLQLRQLQLPDGVFLFELSYERGGLLRP